LKRKQDAEAKQIRDEWDKKSKAYQEWVADKKKEAPNLTEGAVQRTRDENLKKKHELEDLWDDKVVPAGKSKDKGLNKNDVRQMYDDLENALNKRKDDIEAEKEKERESTAGKSFSVEICPKEHEMTKCEICDKPLAKGKIALVDGKNYYHYSCFVCIKCGKLFEDYYWEYKNKPMCQDHYIEAAKLVCAGCGKGIKGKIVKAIDKQKWHAECLNCDTCGVNLMGGKGDNTELFSHQGKPYCRKDYFRAQGLLCHRCEKPIGSGDKSAMGKVWHKTCWYCTKCENAFGPDGYVNVDGWPWCGKCADSK